MPMPPAVAVVKFSGLVSLNAVRSQRRSHTPIHRGVKSMAQDRSVGCFDSPLNAGDSLAEAAVVVRADSQSPASEESRRTRSPPFREIEYGNLEPRTYPAVAARPEPYPVAAAAAENDSFGCKIVGHLRPRSPSPEWAWPRQPSRIGARPHRRGRGHSDGSDRRRLARRTF